MAVFAPIPSASVSTAIAVKLGDLRSIRSPNRRSCRESTIQFTVRISRFPPLVAQSLTYCMRMATQKRRRQSPLRFLEKGDDLSPRNGRLVHREDGGHIKPFSFHSLKDFIGQFRIVKRAVCIDYKRIAGIKNVTRRKIHHILPLRACAAQRIEFEPIFSRPYIYFARDDFPIGPLRRLS